jgi:hypothetical protein
VLRVLGNYGGASEPPNFGTAWNFEERLKIIVKD